MNRRTFAQALATAAVAAAAPKVDYGALPKPDTIPPPFPISVMLWTVFADLPLDQRLAKVAEAGYTHIELVGEYKQWSAADYATAYTARKRFGIHFDATAGITGLADPSRRQAVVAELKQALSPMQNLGCPAMIVLAGNVVPGLSRQAQHQSCIDALTQAAKVIEGLHVDGQPMRLLLECIDPEENPKYFLPSANEAIEIVRAVNHPQVQFLYDIFHEQIAEGNLIEKLDKHIDVIGLIHVADVPGRHQPGTGEINYSNIYRKLALMNYRHVVAMEFHPAGDPVSALRTAREGVSLAV